MALNLFRYASPASFYPTARRMARWFALAAAAFAVAGLWVGLVAAPTDATQGDAYRMISSSVPAAWMSMFIYLRDGVMERAGAGLRHEAPPR